MLCEVVTKRIVATLALGTGLVVSLSANTEVYKSTGAAGETIYSDRPAATGQGERVELAPPPSRAEVEESEARLEEIEKALDENAAQRRKDEVEKLAEKQASEQQEAECKRSKSWLSQLELYPPDRRLVVYPDGTSQRLSWEEMQSLVESARQDVQRNCGDD